MVLKLQIQLQVIFLIILLSTSCSNNNSNDTTKTETFPDSVLIEKKGVNFRSLHLCTELLPPPAPILNIDYRSDTSVIYRSEMMSDTLIATSFRVNEAYIASLKSVYL